MIFYVKYQCDRAAQADAQAFFATMTDEQIANEIPPGCTLLGRWHDVPNGWGISIVEADSQEDLTSWMMGWSALCTFPVITPMLDDNAARKLVNQMLAAQQQ